MGLSLRRAAIRMSWSVGTGSAALLAILLGFLSAIPSPARASAQTAAGFYAGKTITILVGSSANGGQTGLAQTLGQIAGSSYGGDFDTYAEILARYLGSHIPGSPRVVVRNAPGEAGLAPILRILGDRTPEGTILALFDPVVIVDSILGVTSVKADLTDLSWIGSMTPDFRFCYVGHAAGIGSWADLAKSQGLVFGAESLASLSYIDVQMLRRLFHFKIRPILGYPGRKDIYYAIARGELDGGCGPLAGLPSNWLLEDKISPLVRLVEEPIPDLSQQPPYVVAMAKPGEQRQIASLLTGASEVGMPLAVSERTPADRLKELRAAFDATMRDPGFLDAAARRNLTIEPKTGSAAGAIVDRLLASPADLVAQARRIVD